MKQPFFTIGHSNRTLAEFVELLQASQITLVADIRKIPRSRANPQFNEDSLPGALAVVDMAYEHMAALGGLRAKARMSTAQANDFWTNKSFRNYADYTHSAQFHAGLEHLLDAGRGRRCVLMCSEAVWWRCHRRIVADYLIAHGEHVFHIMGRGRVERAQLTTGAAIQPGGRVSYPAAASIGHAHDL